MAKTALLAILSLILVGSIILQPDASFQASLRGLTVWWDIVFPGLLPYFVLYEIMMAFGLAHGLGALLQPVSSRLLRMPGEAALGLVLGWTGGHPAGAEQVARLKEAGRINRQQSQLLLSYSHMPNPLFMTVVVGAAFLQNPIAGFIIAAGVWISAFWLLLLNSLWPSPGTATDPEPNHGKKVMRDNIGLIAAASKAMQEARLRDGRSFGRVLGDAVSSSVQKLMLIGGFMIFASVLARLSQPVLSPLLERGFSFAGPAFFEAHLGAYAASLWDLPGAGLPLVCAMVAAVLSWGGLSGILQAAYAVAGTDIRLGPFILYRLNHALHAFLVTLLLWGPLAKLITMLLPDGGFPVWSNGNSRLSLFEPIRHIPAFSIGGLPSLWPYAAFLFAFGIVLLAVLRMMLKPRPAFKNRS